MLSLLLVLADAPATMPSFLTGCWLSRQGERTSEECWTRGNAGLMIGSGRSWVGETMDHWEWMRIERAPAGLTFHASPKGVAPVAFRAIRATADLIEFENRDHDYPQRVRYWRSPTGLSAEISLADGSKPLRYDFTPMGAAGP